MTEERCRHNRTGEHWYGMGDEPDYDGGEVQDVAFLCPGPYRGKHREKETA